MVKEKVREQHTEADGKFAISFFAHHESGQIVGAMTKEIYTDVANRQSEERAREHAPTGAMGFRGTISKK